MLNARLKAHRETRLPSWKIVAAGKPADHYCNLIVIGCFKHAKRGTLIFLKPRNLFPRTLDLRRLGTTSILPALAEEAEELLVRVLTISAMVLAGTLLSQSGCVRKRMTIVSNPPGAQVFVDNHEIGTTPVSTSYIYYGTRSIRLQKDGYESVTVERNFDPPWYEYPPLDLFSESFLPTELRDERVLEFELIPRQNTASEVVRDRAEELRGQARSGNVVPLAPPILPSAPSPLVP